MKLSFQSENFQLAELESSLNVNNWYDEVRSRTLANLKLQVLPTRKAEHWKYNDMFFLKNTEFDTALIPSETNDEDRLKKTQT